MSTTTTSPPLAAVDRRTTGSLRTVPGRFDGPIDGAFALAMALVAVSALGNVYDGPAFLAVGAVGALAGIAAAALIAWRRLDALLGALVVVAAFVLASGPAAPDQALAGVVPTPASIAAVVTGVVDVWVRLVTTAPPVGLDGGLGVAPYVLGFVAGVGGMLAARRTAVSFLPAVAGLVVLAIALVLGTNQPVSVAVQGGVSAVLVIGWGAVRANRPRRSADGVHWSRLGAAAAMLAVVVGAALLLAPLLPLVDETERYNLRENVVPPFDPRDEPSPLGAFRNYLTEDGREQVEFVAEGLPPGATVRLATMDTFDGVVWVVGGPTAPASGRFERVGSSILPTPPGTPADVVLEAAHDRTDVWVPTVGAMRSATFDGPRARELADAFRYNRTTQAGAVPLRLQAGDRLRVDAQLPVGRDDAALAVVPADSGVQLPELPPIPEDVQKYAADLAAGATTPFDQARRLEQTLSENGFYSDGGAAAANTSSESAPGHSLARIQAFLEQGTKTGYVGNAEQYAATMAVLARVLGLPARVSLGFTPPADASGRVELVGDHVDAWVEIAFEGVGWIPFRPTPPRDRRPLDQPEEKPQEKDLSQQVPPPPTYIRVPDTVPDLDARRTTPPTDEPAAELPFELPTVVLVVAVVVLVPLLAALVLAGLVLAWKRRRSASRRRRGPPARQLAGAWDEACDRVRDLGATVPGGLTRREAAERARATWPDLPVLARHVDQLMFGSAPLDPGQVAGLWDEMEAEHRTVLGGRDRRGRWRARLSLASLRPGRTRPAPTGADEPAQPPPPSAQPAPPPPPTPVGAGAPGSPS